MILRVCIHIHKFLTNNHLIFNNVVYVYIYVKKKTNKKNSQKRLLEIYLLNYKQFNFMLNDKDSAI